MSLDSIMQVIWGGEIGCIAILFGLLPIAFESYRNRYYLGVRFGEKLFNYLKVKQMLFTLLILNVVALIIATIPLNETSPFLMYFVILIIMLCYVLVFHFSYNLMKLLIQNDKEDLVKNEIEETIFDSIYTNQLLLGKNTQLERLELAKKISKEFSSHMSSYHNEEYYEVKEVFDYVASLYKKDIYDNNNLSSNIGVYIGKYVEDLYSYKKLPNQQIYDLLAGFNDYVNGPQERGGLNRNINIFVNDKVWNALKQTAKENEEINQDLELRVNEQRKLS